MKKARLKLFSSWMTSGLRPLPLIAVALLFAGCEDIPTIHRPAGKFIPGNVYLDSDTLPARVRRVAVLPMTTAGSAPLLASGVEALEPVLRAELGKTRKFEVVEVSRDQMIQWTGNPAWRAEEKLPRSLFEHLRDNTGCDAVFFSQVTHYQPYQPLAVGLKMSLVEGTQKTADNEPITQILWSVDENFDAGDPAVANSAQAYYTQHLRRESPSSESTTILSSPSRFGQYTLEAVLATLPKR
jgi:hypothetical protein